MKHKIDENINAYENNDRVSYTGKIVLYKSYIKPIQILYRIPLQILYKKWET
jgi:hypothetical protein